MAGARRPTREGSSGAQAHGQRAQMTPRRRLALAAMLLVLLLLLGFARAAGLPAPADELAMTIVDAVQIHYPAQAAGVTSVASVLHRAGDTGALIATMLVLGLFLAYAGRPREVGWLLAAVMTVILFNPALKAIFAEERPDLIPRVVEVTGHSFPSGHSAGTMALYGAVALLFPGRLIWIACAAMILLTGASRVWLGVHWPTDVVAGWLEAGAWLLVMSIWLPRRERRA